MLSKIADCCRVSADTAEIERVLPLGEIWQAARNSPGFNTPLTGDGESASEAGRFLSSCVLFREIFGESAADIPFDLPGFPKETSDFLKNLSSHN